MTDPLIMTAAWIWAAAIAVVATYQGIKRHREIKARDARDRREFDALSARLAAARAARRRT